MTGIGINIDIIHLDKEISSESRANTPQNEEDLDSKDENDDNDNDNDNDDDDDDDILMHDTTMDTQSNLKTFKFLELSRVSEAETSIGNDQTIIHPKNNHHCDD